MKQKMKEYICSTCDCPVSICTCGEKDNLNFILKKEKQSRFKKMEMTKDDGDENAD